MIKLKNEMIKYDYLEGEVRTMVDYAKSIQYVGERDEEIHAKYLYEKAKTVKYIAEWLISICEEGKNED